MTIEKLNSLLAEIAAEETEARIESYIQELDMEMLLANPRFYGPDYGDECDGLWYWEILK